MLDSYPDPSSSAKVVLERIKAFEPTPDQVLTIAKRLRLYLYTRRALRCCDVRSHQGYQSAFRNFYRVHRMAKEHQAVIFDILEREKASSGLTFESVLREVAAQTQRAEASFSSKVVATISPAAVVYDSQVRKVFELPNIPQSLTLEQRVERAISMHRHIEHTTNIVLKAPDFWALARRFDEGLGKLSGAYGDEFSAIKKLDVMMWQSGRNTGWPPRKRL